MTSWRIATRRSRLARAQARLVAEALAAATGRPAALVPLSTTGDADPERAVRSFDAKGLFVDGVRAAVLDGRCQLAVHSHKDLPSQPVAGLVVAAVPVRADPRDALVTRDGHRLADLPEGATVGTSSARRGAQVLNARPDLRVRPLRGNLDTRLGRVADGDLDAVVVAMAGLVRLDPEDAGVSVVALDHHECLHAPGQGALAVECREGDEATRAALAGIDDPDTHLTVRTERDLLGDLEGGCTAPIGAHARVLAGPDRRVALTALLADPEGSTVLRDSGQAPEGQARALAGRLAASLRERGGEDIVRRLREDRSKRAFGAP